MLRLFLISFLCLGLTACNLQKKVPLKPLNYLEGAEKFDVKEFFSNSQEGFAIILDSQDKIISKFNVKSSGSWEENKGTIKFQYQYSEDKSDFRTWLVTIDNDNNYTIVGHDFLEPAKGRQKGNVSELLYKMNYEFNRQKSKYSFIDNIYQVDKNSVIIITDIINKNQKVGKIISSITKKGNKKAPIINRSPMNVQQQKQEQDLTSESENSSNIDYKVISGPRG